MFRVVGLPTKGEQLPDLSWYKRLGEVLFDSLSILFRLEVFAVELNQSDAAIVFTISVNKPQTRPCPFSFQAFTGYVLDFYDGGVYA